VSDYTPTTSDIYQTYVVGCRASKLRSQKHPDEDSDSRERFVRWLAEELRKAQETAWYQGASAATNYALNGAPSLPENPYEVEE